MGGLASCAYPYGGFDSEAFATVGGAFVAFGGLVVVSRFADGADPCEWCASFAVCWGLLLLWGLLSIGGLLLARLGERCPVAACSWEVSCPMTFWACDVVWFDDRARELGMSVLATNRTWVVA